MRLRVTVEAADRPRVDVMIEAEAEAPAAELLGALARHVGVPAAEAQAAYNQRAGTWLTADGPLLDADLRDGDRLALRPARQAGTEVSPPRAPIVELVIAGGPDAGRRFALAAGEHVVGRGPGADLTLPDRSMSRRHLVLRVGTSGVTVADLGSSNGTYLEGARMDDERAFAPGQALEAGRTLLGIEPARAGERSSGPGATGGRVAFNRPPRVARPQPAQMPPAPRRPRRGDAPRLPLGAALVPLAHRRRDGGDHRQPGLAVLRAAHPGDGAVLARRRPAQRLAPARRRGGGLPARCRRAGRAPAGGPRWPRPRRAVPPAPMSRPSDAGPPSSIPACGSAVRAIADFLELRVGTADVLATARAELAPGGAQDLRDEALKALQPEARLPAVPVIVALGGGVLGLAGPRHRGGRSRAPARHPGGRPAQPRRARGRDRPRRGRGGLGVGGVAAARAPRRRGRGQRGRPRAVRGDRRRAAGGRSSSWTARCGWSPRCSPGSPRRGVGTVICLGRDAHGLPGTCTHVVELAHDRTMLRVVDVAAGTEVDEVSADGHGGGRSRGGGAPARPRRRRRRRGRAAARSRRACPCSSSRHARADRRDRGAALAGERRRSALRRSASPPTASSRSTRGARRACACCWRACPAPGRASCCRR